MIDWPVTVTVKYLSELCPGCYQAFVCDKFVIQLTSVNVYVQPKRELFSSPKLPSSCWFEKGGRGGAEGFEQLPVAFHSPVSGKLTESE